MRRGNMLRAAMYVLNIVLTGLFFSASAIAFQWWVWDICSEIYSGTRTLELPPLLRVYTLFRGYNSNNSVYYIGVIFWLVIVFVTLLSWWQETSRRKMFMRVAVTTWFSFLIYLSSSAAIVVLLGLPMRAICAEMGLENRFAYVLGWLYYLSSRGVLLFFLVLVGRKLYHVIARRRSVQE